MQDQHELNLSAQTMAKCTKSCFMSMKEGELLPTEERCLRNCFIKSNDFNDYFEKEYNFVLRNINKFKH